MLIHANNANQRINTNLRQKEETVPKSEVSTFSLPQLSGTGMIQN